MLICEYCSKECKNPNSKRNHERLCRSNPNRQISTIENARKFLIGTEIKCQFCGVIRNSNNIDKHINGCKLNPKNKTSICPVCDKLFVPNKGKTRTKITCSYSCANKKFRSGPNNGIWKDDVYRTTCFFHHKKECVICGENKIVAVHHYDENHDNNSPENLVPMCPTHHQYMHSRYKVDIEHIVTNYVKKKNINHIRFLKGHRCLMKFFNLICGDLIVHNFQVCGIGVN